MDFERIKKLLIVFLVFFDAYLLYKLVNRIPNFEGISPESSLVLEDDLNSRGIKYPDLSDETSSLSYLKVNTSDHLAQESQKLENQTFSIDSNGVLTSNFDQVYDLELFKEDKNKLSDTDKEKLRNLLNEANLFVEGDKYTVYSYNPYERVIICRMEPLEGYPVLDGTAEIRLYLNDDYHIIGYSQSFQGEFVKLIDEKELISQREAIEAVNQRVETYIPEGAVINNLNLVYYRSHRFEEFSIYGPAWQINYTRTDGSPQNLLVDAITAKPISRSQMSSSE